MGASSYWCPWGRGLGSGSGGWWGAVFLWKTRAKGKAVGRVGGRVGTGKGTGESMRKLCRNYPLANYPLVSSLQKVRKIRAPIKTKSALPPPKPKIPPPPQNEEFYGHGFSCRKNPGIHKIDAPISGPRIADRNFSQDRQPPLTLARGLAYRGGVVDASP